MVQRGRQETAALQSSLVKLRNALFAALLLAAPAARAADPLVAAAGDIACDPADADFNGGAGTATRCRQRATSDLLLGAGYDAILLLGDSQYEDGASAKYQT